jgi:hypothetical protein
MCVLRSWPGIFGAPGFRRFVRGLYAMRGLEIGETFA